MKVGFKSLIVILVVLALVMMPEIVQAGWSGSQTVTLEYDREWLTIYTSVLNYSTTDWLHVTLVVDRHPRLGTDLDLSTTLYLPFDNWLYATFGLRRGVFDSRTPLTPYFSVTYSF